MSEAFLVLSFIFKPIICIIIGMIHNEVVIYFLRFAWLGTL